MRLLANHRKPLGKSASSHLKSRDLPQPEDPPSLKYTLTGVAPANCLFDKSLLHKHSFFNIDELLSSTAQLIGTPV
ncbi:hypothetical protein GE061_006347 [Apolygus lucorum]|uniref:Uncharacterized protein n=1 Tax=Apolygus lucorum TaxID=248454 RepID=A0A6A4J823_APOLU|nr:hypothetical protein GE061_006347 [Apolygus lucorum]